MLSVVHAIPTAVEHQSARANCKALSCWVQVLCRNSGSTLGYGFATLMEEDDSSSEEDEPLRPMSLTEAVP